MASKLSMEQAWLADSRLEQDLRIEAYRLEALGDTPNRMRASKLGTACHDLAKKLRAEADHIVRVWD